jgi:hypothetical protein
LDKKDRRSSQYVETYSAFVKTLRESIKFDYEKRRHGNEREVEACRKRVEGLYSSLVRKLGFLKQKLNEYKLLTYPDEKFDVQQFTILPIKEWEETSAHVVHIYFNEELVCKVAQEFKKE